MLSQEAIEDLKKDCTFEEIQRMQKSLKSIELWKIVSHKYVKNYIDNKLFAKYKVNV